MLPDEHLTLIVEKPLRLYNNNKKFAYYDKLNTTLQAKSVKLI